MWLTIGRVVVSLAREYSFERRAPMITVFTLSILGVAGSTNDSNTIISLHS